jgi:hypothetical protein
VILRILPCDTPYYKLPSREVVECLLLNANISSAHAFLDWNFKFLEDRLFSNIGERRMKLGELIVMNHHGYATLVCIL